MLNKILTLLRAGGALTVDDLVRQTGVPREALCGMLDTLARRELIEWHGRATTGANCPAGLSASPVVTLSLSSEKIKPPAGPGAKGQPKPGEGRGKTGCPAGQSSPE
jgi:hypothetical protein